MNGSKPRTATTDRLAIRVKTPPLAARLDAAAIDPDHARITQFLEDLLRCQRRRTDADLSPPQLQALADLLLLLHSMALTDELTGVCNRRGFLRTGARLLELAARERRAAVLLYVDVDQLKYINDSSGHEAGDRLLKRTAEVLQTAAGTHAVVGRLGGDEFAVLTFPLECGGREQILHRMQEAVDAQNCSSALPPLSLSIGSVEFDPGNPVQIMALLEQADRAMYGHKTGKMRDLDRSVNNARDTAPLPAQELPVANPEEGVGILALSL